ncbi:nitrogen fixation protein FixH [Rubricella aquisinus]|uniref:Nitrogen fixation protein FixH n=1 Tax=Rubricella aquisinus TaxID=2028108 RepID=A0A840WP53_9RHOB|nr:FixH family protein [Rubricella aquisinus]MBB5516411.1 nitrogen fixation protein FixH [Rubricella aquisinus]
MTTETERRFTGKHMAMVMVGAFGTIITVNLTLAYFAVGTFPGLEVKNSYVASQSFDDRKAAQLSLGWTSQAAYETGALVIAVTAIDGTPVLAEDVQIRVGRTTHGREDSFYDFASLRAAQAIPMELAPGAWRVDIKAKGADGTDFVTRHTVYVQG